MTLDDWLVRIERMHPARIELGLGRTRQVAARLDLLPLTMPVVTVAGTNGKGSTATLAERLAREAGWRTGLYTSPHLRRFNERVRVDGIPVDDHGLCTVFARVERARREVPLTYFEFTTLAALDIFRAEAPDVLVLEVGLGGRLDAVNVVDADVAVVTSVGLDHTDWLGDSLELIALEKAGIRRPGRPLLWGGDQLPAEVDSLCRQEGVPLLRTGSDFGARDGQLFWEGLDGQCAIPVAEVPLGTDNLAAAVQALSCVRRLPPPGAIDRVAARATLAGRRQRIEVEGVEWYLDVGHNTEALKRFLGGLPPHGGRVYALAAMLVDKPAADALEAFVPVVDSWYLAGLGGPRGRSAASLRKALPAGTEAHLSNTVAEAVATLRSGVARGDRVLVFGSFHTVAETADALAVDLE